MVGFVLNPLGMCLKLLPWIAGYPAGAPRPCIEYPDRTSCGEALAIKALELAGSITPSAMKPFYQEKREDPPTTNPLNPQKQSARS